MRFLKYVVLGMTFLFTETVYSQFLQTKDSDIVFLSEAENVHYTPLGLITNINFSVLKFRNSQPGIQFSLTTKRTDRESVIRVDSIMLYLGSKVLTITNPYQDTVYLRNNGSLFWSFTHFLKQDEISILKEESITHLGLIVDKQLLKINIMKKSQRKINTIFNKFY